MSHFTRFLNSLLFAATLIVLTACGGSSGGGGDQTGQVSVVITDGPTDIYERVLITLSSMTLIGGGGGHQVIYDGEPITFDLLQLRDRADFAFSQQIAVGDYNKIRLEITGVTLVDLGVVDDPTDDVEVVLQDLPANGKIDLNPQGPFTVVADRATVVELDIDALRSFQVVQTGNDKLKFRPVIFVNVYNDDIVLPSRLTRVFGTVEGVDEVEESLLLCDLQFVAQLGGATASDPSDCVRVFATGANHFGADGLAFADFAALADAIEVADPAAQMTAIGHASLPDSTVDNVVMELDAVITELGPRQIDPDPGWETTAGAIVTDLTATDCVASQCVDFLPAAAGTALTVQLQPETRVFMRNGSELAQADLGAGVSGAFDGLRVDEGGTEEMRASLFVTGPDAGSELVSGMLTAVTPGDTFDILTVQPDAGTPVSVCVTSETDLLQILVDNETVSIVDLLDPAVLNPADGLQVEAAGEPGDGAPCDLDASVVIVE